MERDAAVEWTQDFADIVQTAARMAAAADTAAAAAADAATASVDAAARMIKASWTDDAARVAKTAADASKVALLAADAALQATLTAIDAVVAADPAPTPRPRDPTKIYSSMDDRELVATLMKECKVGYQQKAETNINKLRRPLRNPAGIAFSVTLIWSLIVSRVQELDSDWYMHIPMVCREFMHNSCTAFNATSKATKHVKLPLQFTSILLKLGRIQEVHPPFITPDQSRNLVKATPEYEQVTRQIFCVECSDIMGTNCHRGMQKGGNMTCMCSLCGRTTNQKGELQDGPGVGTARTLEQCKL